MSRDVQTRFTEPRVAGHAGRVHATNVRLHTIFQGISSIGPVEKAAMSLHGLHPGLALQAVVGAPAPEAPRICRVAKTCRLCRVSVRSVRPDERPSANDFTLDQAWEAGKHGQAVSSVSKVADPDLQAFVPLPHDPGRSGLHPSALLRVHEVLHPLCSLGVLTNRPPRELLWSEGSSDGVATPRLMQFMHEAQLPSATPHAWCSAALYVTGQHCHSFGSMTAMVFSGIVAL